METSAQPPPAADSGDATPFARSARENLIRDEEIALEAEPNPPIARRGDRPISLSEFDRARHVYVVGKSGSGKSTLLERIAIADIAAHKATVFIDFHGDSAAAILDAIPSSRGRDVCFINLADDAFAVGFNPLAGIPIAKASLQATNIVQALKDIFGLSWGPRLEWFLWNGLVALIEHPRTSFSDLPPIYYDKKHRQRLTDDLHDPIARDFWQREYPSYDDRYRREAQGPILNKIGQLLASPAVRACFYQTHPKFNLATALNTGQILIVSLAKGAIGDAPARLIGSLLVSELQRLLMARATKLLRPPLSLICDEFQNFGTDAFASLFAEGRKYGLQLTVAHQYTSQLPEPIRAAILGNAGTLVAFRLSHADAALIAPEMSPDAHREFSLHALTALDPFHAIMKRDDTYAIATLPPIVCENSARVLIESSRQRFARRIA